MKLVLHMLSFRIEGSSAYATLHPGKESPSNHQLDIIEAYLRRYRPSEEDDGMDLV